MAAFNLTAQLQLQAPGNVAQVVSAIKKQLAPIGVKVTVAGDARSLAQINQQLQNTNKYAKASARSVGELNKTLQESARRFSVITLATGTLLGFVAAVKNSVRAAIDFEKSLVNLSQITGKSTSELKSLSDEVTRLATSFGTSSSELIKAAEVLTQAGFSAETTKGILKSLAQTTLAASFGKIQDTTEGVIASLAQFAGELVTTEQQVRFVERSLDSINAVSKAFAVESSDLITVIRRTGGVFAAAGGNIEELIALFTSVRATTRESAETIATGLRTIFTRIQRTDTVEQLKAIGIELRDTSGRFVGAYEAVRRLSEGLSSIDPSDYRFAEIIEELGGFRQVGKVIPLILQFATAQRALNVAQGASGSLAKDAETAQQSLANQIIKVKEEFDALIRKFAASETFRSIAGGALELARAFIKVADTLEPLLPLITSLFALKLGSGLAPALAGFVGIGAGAGRGGPGRVSRFATGGFVPGSGNSDSVPAMLTPGEFVIKKSSAKKLGASTLSAMNNNKYASGGQIKVQDGAIGGFFLQPEQGDPRNFNMRNRSVEITGLKAIKALSPNNKQPKQKDIETQSLLNLPKEKQAQLLFGKGKNSIKEYDRMFPSGISIGSGANDLKRSDVKNLLAQKDVNSRLQQFYKGKATSKYGERQLDPVTATLSGPIKGFFPGQDDLKKNAKISNAVHGVTSEGLRNTVLTASKIVSRLALPSIQPNKETMKDGANRLSKDANALRSVSGFVFEGVVNAITGAKLAGNTSNFDFPSSSIGPARENLKQLFTSSDGEGIDNLIKADAKRSASTDNFNSIAKKIVNDINAGLLEGVSFTRSDEKQTKEVKKKASGGGISGSDTVPALLTPGEFVVNKKAASSIGYGNLHSMNKTGVAHFASGGIVGTPIQRFAPGGSVGAAGAAFSTGGSNLNIANLVSPGALQLLNKSIGSTAHRLTDTYLALKTLSKNIGDMGDSSKGAKLALSAFASALKSGFASDKALQAAQETLTAAMARKTNSLALGKDQFLNTGYTQKQLAQMNPTTINTGQLAQSYGVVKAQTTTTGPTPAGVAPVATLGNIQQNLQSAFKQMGIGGTQLQAVLKQTAQSLNQGKTSLQAFASGVQFLAKTAEEEQRRMARVKKITKAAGAVQSGAEKVSNIASTLQNVAFLGSAVAAVTSQMSSLDDATKTAVSQTSMFVATIVGIGATLVTTFGQIIASVAGTITSFVSQTAASGVAAVSDGAEAVATGLATAALAPFTIAIIAAEVAILAIVIALAAAAAGAYYFSSKAQAEADILSKGVSDSLEKIRTGKAGAMGVEQMKEANIQSITKSTEASNIWSPDFLFTMLKEFGLHLAMLANPFTVVYAAFMHLKENILGANGALAKFAEGEWLDGILSFIPGWNSAMSEAEEKTKRQVEAQQKNIESLNQLTAAFVENEMATRTMNVQLESVSSNKSLKPEERVKQTIQAMGTKPGDIGGSQRYLESYQQASQNVTEQQRFLTFGKVKKGVGEATEADFKQAAKKQGLDPAEGAVRYALAKRSIEGMDSSLQALQDRFKIASKAFEEGTQTEEFRIMALNAKDADAALQQLKTGSDAASLAFQAQINTAKAVNAAQVAQAKQAIEAATTVKDRETAEKNLAEVERSGAENIKALEASAAGSVKSTKAQEAAIERERQAHIALSEKINKVNNFLDKLSDRDFNLDKQAKQIENFVSALEGKVSGVQADQIRGIESPTEIFDIPRLQSQLENAIAIAPAAMQADLRTFRDEVVKTSQIFSKARKTAAEGGIIGKNFTKLKDPTKEIEESLSAIGVTKTSVGDKIYAEIFAKIKEVGGSITEDDLKAIFAPLAQSSEKAAQVFQQLQAQRQKELDSYLQYLNAIKSIRDQELEGSRRIANAQIRTLDILEKARNVKTPDIRARETIRQRAAQRALDLGGVGVAAGDVRGLSRARASAGANLQQINKLKTVDESEFSKRRIVIGGQEIKSKTDLLKAENKQIAILNATNKELERLGDQSERVSEIQSEIEKEQRSREQMKEFAKSFVVGGEEDRSSMMESIQGLNFAFSQGTLQNLPEDLRKSVAGLLGQLGDVRLVGGATGKEILDEFVLRDAVRMGFPPEWIKALYGATTKEEQLIQALTNLTNQIRAATQAGAGVVAGKPAEPKAAGGLIHRASGGSIFQSKGTDTVPAMLTPGEFVVRKSAVDKVGISTLQDINQGNVSAQTFAKGGKAKKYNIGLNQIKDNEKTKDEDESEATFISPYQIQTNKKGEEESQLYGRVQMFDNQGKPILDKDGKPTYKKSDNFGVGEGGGWLDFSGKAKEKQQAAEYRSPYWQDDKSGWSSAPGIADPQGKNLIDKSGRAISPAELASWYKSNFGFDINPQAGNAAAPELDLASTGVPFSEAVNEWVKRQSVQDEAREMVGVRNGPMVITGGQTANLNAIDDNTLAQTYQDIKEKRQMEEAVLAPQREARKRQTTMAQLETDLRNDVSYTSVMANSMADTVGYGADALFGSYLEQNETKKKINPLDETPMDAAYASIYGNMNESARGIQSGLSDVGQYMQQARRGELYDQQFRTWRDSLPLMERTDTQENLIKRFEDEYWNKKQGLIGTDTETARKLQTDQYVHSKEYGSDFLNTMSLVTLPISVPVSTAFMAGKAAMDVMDSEKSFGQKALSVGFAALPMAGRFVKPAAGLLGKGLKNLGSGLAKTRIGQTVTQSVVGKVATGGAKIVSGAVTGTGAILKKTWNKYDEFMSRDWEEVLKSGVKGAYGAATRGYGAAKSGYQGAMNAGSRAYLGGQNLMNQGYQGARKLAGGIRNRFVKPVKPQTSIQAFRSGNWRGNSSSYIPDGGISAPVSPTVGTSGPGGVAAWTSAVPQAQAAKAAQAAAKAEQEALMYNHLLPSPKAVGSPTGGVGGVSESVLQQSARDAEALAPIMSQGIAAETKAEALVRNQLFPSRFSSSYGVKKGDLPRILDENLIEPGLTGRLPYSRAKVTAEQTAQTNEFNRRTFLSGTGSPRQARRPGDQPPDVIKRKNAQKTATRPAVPTSSAPPKAPVTPTTPVAVPASPAPSSPSVNLTGEFPPENYMTGLAPPGTGNAARARAMQARIARAEENQAIYQSQYASGITPNQNEFSFFTPMSSSLRYKDKYLDRGIESFTNQKFLSINKIDFENFDELITMAGNRGSDFGQGFTQAFRKTLVEDVNAGKINTLAEAKNYLDEAISKWKTNGFSTGGLVSYFAKGGSIFKPRGTDTVPAMLTPGEFVVRKSAVDKVGVDTLQAINQGQDVAGYSKGGPVYLAKAGPVPPKPAAAPAAAAGFQQVSSPSMRFQQFLNEFQGASAARQQELFKIIDTQDGKNTADNNLSLEDMVFAFGPLTEQIMNKIPQGVVAGAIDFTAFKAGMQAVANDGLAPVAQDQVQQEEAAAMGAPVVQLQEGIISGELYKNIIASIAKNYAPNKIFQLLVDGGIWDSAKKAESMKEMRTSAKDNMNKQQKYFDIIDAFATEATLPTGQYLNKLIELKESGLITAADMSGLTIKTPDKIEPVLDLSQDILNSLKDFVISNPAEFSSLKRSPDGDTQEFLDPSIFDSSDYFNFISAGLNEDVLKKIQAKAKEFLNIKNKSIYDQLSGQWVNLNKELAKLSLLGSDLKGPRDKYKSSLLKILELKGVQPIETQVDTAISGIESKFFEYLGLVNTATSDAGNSNYINAINTLNSGTTANISSGITDDKKIKEYVANLGALQQLSTGGKVLYRAGGGSIFKPRGTDTVPAMLTPGEFVIRKSAVDKVGVSTLQSINNGDASVVNKASGGLIYAQTGMKKPVEKRPPSNIIVPEPMTLNAPPIAPPIMPNPIMPNPIDILNKVIPKVPNPIDILNKVIPKGSSPTDDWQKKPIPDGLKDIFNKPIDPKSREDIDFWENLGKDPLPPFPEDYLRPPGGSPLYPEPPLISQLPGPGIETPEVPYDLISSSQVFYGILTEEEDMIEKIKLFLNTIPDVDKTADIQIPTIPDLYKEKFPNIISDTLSDILKGGKPIPDDDPSINPQIKKLRERYLRYIPRGPGGPGDIPMTGPRIPPGIPPEWKEYIRTGKPPQTINPPVTPIQPPKIEKPIPIAPADPKPKVGGGFRETPEAKAKRLKDQENFKKGIQQNKAFGGLIYAQTGTSRPVDPKLQEDKNKLAQKIRNTVEADAAVAAPPPNLGTPDSSPPPKKVKPGPWSPGPGSSPGTGPGVPVRGVPRFPPGYSDRDKIDYNAAIELLKKGTQPKINIKEVEAWMEWIRAGGQGLPPTGRAEKKAFGGLIYAQAGSDKPIPEPEKDKPLPEIAERFKTYLEATRPSPAKPLTPGPWSPGPGSSPGTGPGVPVRGVPRFPPGYSDRDKIDYNAAIELLKKGTQPKINIKEVEAWMEWIRAGGQGLPPTGRAEKPVKPVAPKAFGGLISSYFESGGGASAADSVPAMLTPGEFVMSAGAVSKYGVAAMQNLNRGKVKGFNKGGFVGGVAYKQGGGMAGPGAPMQVDTSRLESALNTFTSSVLPVFSNVSSVFTNLNYTISNLTSQLGSLANQFSSGFKVEHTHTVTIDGGINILGLNIPGISKEIVYKVSEMVIEKVKEQIENPSLWQKPNGPA